MGSAQTFECPSLDDRSYVTQNWTCDEIEQFQGLKSIYETVFMITKPSIMIIFLALTILVAHKKIKGKNQEVSNLPLLCSSLVFLTCVLGLVRSQTLFKEGSREKTRTFNIGISLFILEIGLFFLTHWIIAHQYWTSAREINFMLTFDRETPTKPSL